MHINIIHYLMFLELLLIPMRPRIHNAVVPLLQYFSLSQSQLL